MHRHVAFAAASALLLAVAALSPSRVHGADAAGGTDARTTDTGWHCERNAAGDWTCVENEAIRAPAAPAAPPEPSTPPAAAAPATDSTDTSRLEAIVEQRSAAGARRLAERAAQAERAAAAAREAAARQASATSAPHAGAEPLQPDERVGIMDLPDNYYTVQLLALSSRAALERFAREHQLYDLSAARIASGGELRYVLLMGAYPDPEAARNAAALLPDFLREIGPWIRTLGSLKQAMRAGDALVEAGGDGAADG